LYPFSQDTHVSLKVFTRNAEHQQEIDNYAKLSRGNQSHIGSNLVRGALGSFTLARPGGDPHYCLVQEPMLDSFHDLVTRYSHRNRFTEELLKAGLRYLFSALDYVHSECQLIHTDIKPANILQTIADTSVFEAYTKAELEGPVPRKYVQLDDGSMTTVYGSRLIRKPSSWGYPVLGDFGSAVDGNKKHTFDAQPSIYRCPEVMLRAEWGYPADIWNVGAMVSPPALCSVIINLIALVHLDMGSFPMQEHVRWARS
jgi:serine/threonine-protein kinase SRPK3